MSDYIMSVEITSVWNGKSLILRDDGELIFVGKKIEDCPAEPGRVPICPAGETYQFFNLILLEGKDTEKFAISTPENNRYLGTDVEHKARVDQSNRVGSSEKFTPINIFGDIYAFKCNYKKDDEMYEKYLSINTDYNLLIVRDSKIDENLIDRTELFRVQPHYGSV
ncbi:hypothetical protein BGP34_22355 [Bacillus mycoides]|uniref:hypothetical protein n=1 Tax=Bacillus mycoides TaxID=1405 RepID=UPI0009937328|nr:hypothetical protein [Bacillus mycoides]OOR55598.1 hypothetical protein BGP34_22355 [Bacillus mycoides]